MASTAFSVPDSVPIIYLSYKEMMAFGTVAMKNGGKDSAVGYSAVLFYICPWSLIFKFICD